MSTGWSITPQARGFRQAQANLDKLVGKVERQGKRRALRKSLKPMIQAARSFVPIRYGVLKRSLGAVIRTYTQRKQIVAIVGARRGFKTVIEGQSVDPAHYSHLVEHGTVHSAAHPFLRPAFDTAKGAALNAYAGDLSGFIDAEAAKMQAKLNSGRVRL